MVEQVLVVSRVGLVGFVPTQPSEDEANGEIGHGGERTGQEERVGGFERFHVFSLSRM